MTSQAGVKLNMKVLKYTIAVIIEKFKPPQIHEGLSNTSWTFSGQVPFRYGGPFSLTGVNKKTKSLAVFVGSCRVCKSVNTIEGVWTVSRKPHDCSDFQVATGIHNNIFRRVKLYNGRRKEEKEKS
ncbi:uncharacterized protein LOC117180863 isoform X2 [Belonocnema kinseyi]|nr:uncharacterized protein LOC117180863 isoform X2 [Belonocnema kinseyi]